jgi:AcrR family transcriptional regulator
MHSFSIVFLLRKGSRKAKRQILSPAAGTNDLALRPQFYLILRSTSTQVRLVTGQSLDKRHDIQYIKCTTLTNGPFIARWIGRSGSPPKRKTECMPKIVDEQMREATRNRIVRVAASEFARLGFDQANINVIAEQAGIGKGTIYLYFESKRDLFLSMLRSIAQEQLAAIRQAIAVEGTIRQRLERLFRAFAHLAAVESDSFNVYMSALYGVNRAFQSEATGLLRDYVAVIALMLEQGQARGEIRSHNV